MNESRAKGLETYRRNAEARKQRIEAQRAQEEQDRPLVLEVLRNVLKDPEATAEQRLYAVTVLDSMQHYGFVPYDVKHPGKGSDALIANFAKELEAHREKGK